MRVRSGKRVSARRRKRPSGTQPMGELRCAHLQDHRRSEPVEITVSTLPLLDRMNAQLIPCVYRCPSTRLGNSFADACCPPARLRPLLSVQRSAPEAGSPNRQHTYPVPCTARPRPAHQLHSFPALPVPRLFNTHSLVIIHRIRAVPRELPQSRDSVASVATRE